MTWITYTGVESPFGPGYRRDFVISEHCQKCGCDRNLNGRNINSSQMPWQCGGCNAPIKLFFNVTAAKADNDICSYVKPPLPAYLAAFGNHPTPLTSGRPIAIINVDAPPQTVEVERSSPKPPIDYFAINKSIAGG